MGIVMNMSLTNELLKDSLRKQLNEIENFLEADFISFSGQIIAGSEFQFLRIIEDLVKDTNKKDTLYIMLTTPGGCAETVERYVNIIRHHYKIVNFIIPDYAYSAGTIFCMSGDDIYMDYYSALGPIDPQVQNRDGNPVAALGYLDKVNELVDKAKNNELTQAEFLILKDIDLAELRSYEQAKELTIDLLKNWLVQYKFKNWKVHRTDQIKKGKPVTPEEKKERAEDIAGKLSDNNFWKSHARPINIHSLKQMLHLEIQDYSNNVPLKEKIRNYYFLLNDYLRNNGYRMYIQTRRLI